MVALPVELKLIASNQRCTKWLILQNLQHHRKLVAEVRGHTVTELLGLFDSRLLLVLQLFHFLVLIGEGLRRCFGFRSLAPGTCARQTHTHTHTHTNTHTQTQTQTHTQTHTHTDKHTDTHTSRRFIQLHTHTETHS